ncbi:hypothetical protein [Pleomorphochaeta sp. DL1XJH-081]|uniref:hypothetical protein n=1 Tax=Pleomorphochaeta sp. DL1XJH-081 TaxID=3409690 RepID=UPI003BB618F9
MRKVLCLVVVLLLLSSVAAFAAQPREGIGVGGITGLPFHIGAAAEYNFGAASANASLGYLRYGTNYFQIKLGGDYNFPDPFVQSAWDMDLYLSVGGQFAIDIGPVAVFSLGIPVTWSFFMENMPLKVFVKAGPELYFGWGTSLGFSGSAGAYYLL